MPGVSYLLLLLPVILGPSSRQDPITTGRDVVRAMHHKYDGKWFRTLSFVQRAIFADGRPEEEWWEAAIIPGRLRIDFAPLDSGRTSIYRADSIFAFNHGQLTRSTAGRNILAIMAFDVYGQPPEQTQALVKGEGFNLDQLRQDTFHGIPCWVIGDDAHQLWVEKERLILHRVVQKGANDAVTDISFSKFEPLGGGWIGTEVLFLRNGNEFFREVYRDWRINPAVTDELFQLPWRPASWVPKQ
mgnify:CR=1 FL=1